MNILQKISWHLNRKFYSVVFFVRFFTYPYATISGIKIPVNCKWSFPMLKALFNRNYERGELSILVHALEKDDKVLEIGAGLGLLSAYCAKAIGNEKVKTFEANPFLEKPIRKLYSINNVNPTLCISLVTNKTEYIKFYAEPKDIWSSSLLKLSETAVELILETTNICEIIRDFKPNFLVVDIEGAEYELLPQVDFSLINKIQIELHEKLLGKRKIDELKEVLLRQGFTQNSILSVEEQFYFERN